MLLPQNRGIVRGGRAPRPVTKDGWVDAGRVTRDGMAADG